MEEELRQWAYEQYLDSQDDVPFDEWFAELSGTIWFASKRLNLALEQVYKAFIEGYKAGRE